MIDRSRRAVGPREPIRERGDSIGIGAAETVDRRIGVAEHHHIRAATSDEFEQLHLGRIGVGELVNVDVRRATPLGRQQIGIGPQQVGRGTDQFGAVVADAGPTGRVAQREHLVVFGEEPGRRTPIGPAVLVAESGQLACTDAAFGRTQHKVAQLARERSGPQCLTETGRPHRGVAVVQQFADHEILFGPGQQARVRLAELRRRPPEQAERVPMEGAHDGLGGDVTATVHIGPDERGLDASAQRGRTAAPERQHHDARRIDAGRDPRGDRRDQQ